MSRLSLTTNIASMNAQRNFTRASKDLETSFSRLSSGMRINRASDDAAGLSVSSLLNADRAVLAQGIRNLNDGISYLNIAEGAITELTNIMFRIQEIAEQSANGTLNSAQRKPLQDEVTALQNEYNRIIRSTKFNDMQLLTGVNTLVNLQGGYGVAGGLAVQVGNALTTDAFGTLSAGETTLLSVNGSGAMGNSMSIIQSVSADGRYIAFHSDSTNLISGVSGDQIYIKDTVTGELRLGSSTADGVQANSISNYASLSADGRYLAFRSDSTNLIPGVSGVQIYIKDLVTGELRLGSGDLYGTHGNGSSDWASLSADGRYLAFHSNSTNLISGVGGWQVYIKDLVTGELKLGSSAVNGIQGNGSSTGAHFSADGRYFAFRSNSTNLISGVSGWQIYIKDLVTGELKLGSSTADGVQGNASSYNAKLSADGRSLAFQSNSTNLISGVSGNQIYVKDLVTGELRLASSTADGVQGNNYSHNANLSADGRYVSFYSFSSNIINGVGGLQVYRKDMQTGEVEVASIDIYNENINSMLDDGFAYGPFISADGQKVFFSLDFDGNEYTQVYSRSMLKTGVDELAGMVVSNQASARVTLSLSKQRLETLNLARAGIGASTSRIDTAISNLSTMTQNYASAASQITDTDVAEESAKLAASQILQQAGAAVLSQANIQPQLVLTLLKDI